MLWVVQWTENILPTSLSWLLNDIKKKIVFFKWRQPRSKDEWLSFLTCAILQRRTLSCAVWRPLYHSEMQWEEGNEIFLGAAKRIGPNQHESSHLLSQHLRDGGRKIMSLRLAWTPEWVPDQSVVAGGWRVRKTVRTFLHWPHCKAGTGPALGPHPCCLVMTYSSHLPLGYLGGNGRAQRCLFFVWF